jgi:hypothetical protein
MLALASLRSLCDTWGMSEAQLNIRSTKAKNLASTLARQQRRTVSQIVELALEHYSNELPKVKVHAQEASNFWKDLNKSLYPTGKEPDIDLEAVVNHRREPHDPIKL